MHDSGAEKPFSLTGLNGQFVTHAQQLQLQKEKTYRWKINSFSNKVTQGLGKWLKQLPDDVELKNAPLIINAVHLAQPATTYTKLLRQQKKPLAVSALALLAPRAFAAKVTISLCPGQPTFFTAILDDGTTLPKSK